MGEIVRELVKLGISKYKIAKRLDVHWNTVRRWEMNQYNPSEEHGVRLLEMLERAKQND